MERISSETISHGKNIRRLREILGVKQETIALGLNISQQAMSKLEQRDQIEDDVLEKISKILHITVDAIKNFNEEATVTFVANTFNESSYIGYNPTINPIDKVIELYERLLKVEQEKYVQLEKYIFKNN